MKIRARDFSSDTRVESWDFTFPAAPTSALPTTVFQDKHTVHINGTSLELKHYSAAHTDSDISVHFADVDVLQTGDTFWNGGYPFIDYSTGGSIDGQIRAEQLVKAGQQIRHRFALKLSRIDNRSDLAHAARL
jgi:glyoxylase-like metal-dependent hydrolase (beta-lactamase superfamily II)